MPQSNTDQYFASSHYVDQNGHALSAVEPARDAAMNVSECIASTALVTTPGSLAGRKRSRGDIFAEEETVSASTAQRPVFELTHVKRPSITSRKSQRIDSSVTSTDELAQLVLPPQMREITREPLINEATRVLGISWVRMDSTEARRISQAAYTKWIQNHYPSLTDVEIWFEYGSDEVPAYLVKALKIYSGQHEYYIFSHDLTEARLVTREAADLLPRLKLMPALHLAAPGGNIKAQSEPINAVQQQVGRRSHGPQSTNSGC